MHIARSGVGCMTVILMFLLSACAPAADSPAANTSSQAPQQQHTATPAALPTRAITPQTSIAVDGALALATPPLSLTFEATGIDRGATCQVFRQTQHELREIQSAHFVSGVGL
jgi:hypothetical protein